MHARSLEHLRHDHDYSLASQQSAERRTLFVFWLTLITMAVELVTGYLTGSLALTADGWHMGSHAAALGIAAYAYAFSRRHASNVRFTFGTGKVGPLAAYTSAVFLAMIAVMMVYQSVDRLITPISVRFDEAIAVAVLGLLVNVASAVILQFGGHEHHDHHGDEAGHHHHHAHDHNLRAAYLHVLADALTSVLAIIALLSGKLLGWLWMDPAMGIVGAALIARWSAGLIRDSGQVLLDAEENSKLVERISRLIESDRDNRIADLHLWRLGPGSYGCILSIVTDDPQPAAYYKRLLAEAAELQHVTVEVNLCQDERCGPER
ncbi:MAG: CDF family Co(II)/Ni(II) efflux transporter DmeF [Betaproteobacteria bacterium]|nr:CDF family Co(II)/Ni(II) efflux transporter DmeF [Betaproteobacteria bacterium]